MRFFLSGTACFRLPWFSSRAAGLVVRVNRPTDACMVFLRRRTSRCNAACVGMRVVATSSTSDSVSSLSPGEETAVSGIGPTGSVRPSFSRWFKSPLGKGRNQTDKGKGRKETRWRHEDDGDAGGMRRRVSSSDADMAVPEPAFVVKMRDRTTGKKVFLNVAAHESVPDVDDWDGVDRATRGDLAEVKRMRIPMRMSVLRDDVDKAGKQCKVADCVVHIEVVKQAAKRKEFQTLLIHAAIDLLQEKQSMLDLEPGYKLPKLRYKGNTVQPMRIQPNLITELNSSTPQVTETTHPNKDNPCSKQTYQRGDGKGITIAYEGIPVQAMRVTVLLTHIHPLEILAVKVNMDRLQVHHVGGQVIDVELSFYADATHSHAHLHKDKSLTVHLPVLPYLEYCKQHSGQLCGITMGG